MHEIADLNEMIAGILTLNYEDMLDWSIQQIKGGINYSIEIKNRHDKFNVDKKIDIPLLKLHGSFNWKNEYPMALMNDRDIAKPEEVLWIPPGVEKKRDKYPFSVLWGKALEILDCDCNPPLK